MASNLTGTSTGVFERIGTYEGWDQDYYHPISARYYDRAIRELMAWLRPDGPVLDAGCGPGVHSIRAARLGYEVVAVDVSAAAIEESKRRARAAGVLDRIRFSQADLTQLDFEDASFSAIFSWGVLTHIPHIERALDELARVLRPGGRLAIQITNATAVDYRLLRAARGIARRPLALEHRAFGNGYEYDHGGEKLWVWQASVDAITAHLATRGLRAAGRRAAELSELHRYAPRWMSPALLSANNAGYRLGLPAGAARTNLLLFEKAAD